MKCFGILVFENGPIRVGVRSPDRPFDSRNILCVCFDSPGPNSEQALGGGTLRFEVEQLYDEVNIEVESLGANGPAAAEFIKPDIVAGNSVIHIVTNPLFHEVVPGARGREENRP